jgi:hypothetical protein
MYRQNDHLELSRTRSGHIHNDFFNLIENHSFSQDNQGEFEYGSTADNSKYSEPSIQDYSQSNFMDFDANLVSEIHHPLEFAQPTQTINQAQGAQGGTTATIISNNNSLLPNLNATEVNNIVPITHITPNKPMDQEWNMIKKVPEPVQSKDKLLLPPVKNCQHEMENHTIEKNKSKMASRNQTPKSWRVVKDIAEQIKKQSPPNDNNTLKDDNLFKTKPTIKKNTISVSKTSSTQTKTKPRIIQTKSTQTEYTHANKQKLNLASRYSNLQSILRALEDMESIKHRTMEHSRMNSKEKQIVLHEFNIQVAELNRDEVLKIQSLYSKRSSSKQQK